MTNLEKIKSVLYESINSMSEEVLFEFLSDYEEGSEPYFPSEILFTCLKCRDMYGKCEAHFTGECNYQICQDRFKDYCKGECV